MRGGEARAILRREAGGGEETRETSHRCRFRDEPGAVVRDRGGGKVGIGVEGEHATPVRKRSRVPPPVARRLDVREAAAAVARIGTVHPSANEMIVDPYARAEAPRGRRVAAAGGDDHGSLDSLRAGRNGDASAGALAGAPPVRRVGPAGVDDRGSLDPRRAGGTANAVAGALDAIDAGGREDL